MEARTGSLWRNQDFLKLWAGETVSLFGSQFTALALPLAAAVVLGATPLQMGVLNAAGYAPYLLVTLFAGVWIDRCRRRPLLISANAGRAVLLGLIPLSFVLGLLRMEVLYIIAFLTGVLTVLFDLAYQAYLPSLVDRSQLVEGNSKLQISASVAEVGGPGLAGVLVNLLTAPVVILLDSVSYGISVFSLILIRKDEPESAGMAHRGILREIAGGLRTVLSNPYLRALVGEAATFNLSQQVVWAVLVLYMTRQLQIGASLMGFMFAASSAGSLLGSLMADRVGRRFGVGPAIIGSMALACGSALLMPLAAGHLYVAVAILTLSMFLGGAGVIISNVHVVSLRQAIIPPQALGRLNASYRFVVTGAAPIGALIGGVLGNSIGLRATLAVGALGTLSALGWVLFSPVARLRRLPAVIESLERAGGKGCITARS